MVFASIREHAEHCYFFASTSRNKKFALRACEQLQKFGEHEQASTRLNFASKSSKGKILRAVKNFHGPFITRNFTESSLLLVSALESTQRWMRTATDEIKPFGSLNRLSRNIKIFNLRWKANSQRCGFYLRFSCFLTTLREKMFLYRSHAQPTFINVL